MEKEIGQTLEELRRQNDIRRMNSIQEQVIKYILIILIFSIQIY